MIKITCVVSVADATTKTINQLKLAAVIWTNVFCYLGWRCHTYSTVCKLYGWVSAPYKNKVSSKQAKYVLPVLSQWSCKWCSTFGQRDIHLPFSSSSSFGRVRSRFIWTQWHFLSQWYWTSCLPGARAVSVIKSRLIKLWTTQQGKDYFYIVQMSKQKEITFQIMM